MKKYKSSILILLLLTLLMASVSYAEPIKVYVNDSKVEMPVEPIVKEGRTLVPLRAIFEILGATVDWDQTTKTVTGVLDEKIIKLQVNNKIANINGKDVELDVPAIVVNGSALVPVRFIAESLGAKVDWDSNTKSVLVNSEYPYGKYKVVKVVDGDTIAVDFNGKEERVRLIGVDTPESVHPDAAKNVEEGKIASNFTKAKLEGKEIALEFDVQERDKYSRLLAYVWFGGEMFNKTLLKEGYAQIATFPPNVKYVDDFTKIQEEARKNNKGLWSNNTFNSQSNTGTSVIKTTGKYVGSTDSDKYHYPTCRWAKKILKENEIWFDTIEEAKEHGYKPCEVCNPR